MKRGLLFAALIACVAVAVGMTVSTSDSMSDTDIATFPDGTFMSAHIKDITFYNSSKKNCWFRITGAEWIFRNGTIVFNSTDEIKVETQRNLKGSVWVCTKYGWNPLGGKAEYYKDRGYCYITSLKYGEAKIPASKLVRGEEYTLIVELIDTYYILDKEEERAYWIKIDDPDTFDRVEILGYGPISRSHFRIIIN